MIEEIQIAFDEENPHPQLPQNRNLALEENKLEEEVNFKEDNETQVEENYKKDSKKIEEKLCQLEDRDKLIEEQTAQEQLWKEIKRRMLSTNLTDRRAVGGLLGTAILGIIGLAVGLNIIGIVVGGVLGALLGVYVGRKIKERALKKKKLMNINIEIVKLAAFSQSMIDFDPKKVTTEEIVRLMKLMLRESKMLLMMNKKLHKSEKKQVNKILSRLVKCLKKKKYMYSIKEGYWIVKLWCKQQQSGTSEEKLRCQLVERQVAEIAFQFIRPLSKLMSLNRKVLDQNQKKLENSIHSILLSVPVIELNEKYPEFIKRYEVAQDEFLETIYKEIDLMQLKAIMEDEIAQEILQQDKHQMANSQQNNNKDSDIPSLQINVIQVNDGGNININSRPCNSNPSDIQNKTKAGGSQSQSLQNNGVPKQRLIDLIQMVSQNQQQDKNTIVPSQYTRPLFEMSTSISHFPSKIDNNNEPFHLTPKVFLEGGQKENHFKKEGTLNKSENSKEQNGGPSNCCRIEINKLLEYQKAVVCNQEKQNQVSKRKASEEGYIIPKNIVDDHDEDCGIESVNSIKDRGEVEDKEGKNRKDTSSSPPYKRKGQSNKKGNNNSSNRSKNKSVKSKQITQPVYSLSYNQGFKNFKMNNKQSDLPSPLKELNGTNETQLLNTITELKQFNEGIQNRDIHNVIQNNANNFKLNNQRDFFLKMNSSENLIVALNSSIQKEKQIQNCKNESETKNTCFLSQDDFTIEITTPKENDEHLIRSGQDEDSIEKKLIQIQRILSEDISPPSYNLMHSACDLTIHSKQISNNSLIFASIKLLGFTPEEVLQQIENPNNIKERGKFARDYQVCKTISKDEEIIYFNIDFGFGIMKRDFLYKKVLRRDFPSQGETALLFFSINSPSFSEKKGYIRAWSDASAFVIKQYPQDSSSCILNIIIQSDLKGKIPKPIINYIITRQTVKWINSLKKQIMDSRQLLPEIVIRN